MKILTVITKAINTLNDKGKGNPNFDCPFMAVFGNCLKAQEREITDSYNKMIWFQLIFRILSGNSLFFKVLKIIG